MTQKIDEELVEQLRASLDAGFSDDALKGVNKKVEEIVDNLQSDLEYSIKDNAALNLSYWVEYMAEQAVEQLLLGNEDQMRRYLSCEKRDESGEYIGWTGRSDYEGWGRKREDREWHPVIHGKLHEQGAVALRKQIVEAHRELLVNERILDLEDRVKSLVAQVNEATRQKEAMWERLRASQ